MTGPRPACTAGCCVVVTDAAYEPSGSGVARPMFQVLPDRGDLGFGFVSEHDQRAMHVPADEYQRPDRWWL